MLIRTTKEICWMAQIPSLMVGFVILRNLPMMEKLMPAFFTSFCWCASLRCCMQKGPSPCYNNPVFIHRNQLGKHGNCITKSHTLRFRLNCRQCPIARAFGVTSNFSLDKPKAQAISDSTGDFCNAICSSPCARDKDLWTDRAFDPIVLEQGHPRGPKRLFEILPCK